MTNWTTLALTIGVGGFAQATAAKPAPQVTVTVLITAPIDKAFNYIVPVDLAHIFKRYKRLPGVLKTDETETWIKSGLTRTVFFDDGSTARETLLSVVDPASFSYKIENFTSPLRFLARRIEGSWAFTDLRNGQIKIEWTYKVIPKNSIARGLINSILLNDVKVVLTNALATLKDDLESDRYQPIDR